MDPSKVNNTPKDRTVTYGRIVVDYRTQKANPNRVLSHIQEISPPAQPTRHNQNVMEQCVEYKRSTVYVHWH